ncbi:hypothetical protein BH23BAC3_BH23BAC3_34060 [soil metagenome]
MKRVNRLYLILIILFIGSCSDGLFHQSDREASVVLDEGSQLTVQQRSEIAKSQLKSNEFTRWDTPWWVMSDEDMADSLRAAGGEVIISFKESDRIAGVDERGKTVVSDQNEEFRNPGN